MTSFYGFIIRNHRLVLFLMLILTMPFVLRTLTPPVDNRITFYFDKGDPALGHYQEFRRTFGSDDVVVLALKDRQSVFQPTTITLVSQLTNRLQELPGILQVRSLTSDGMAAATEDGLGYAPLLSVDDLSRAALDRAAALTAETGRAVSRLVSDDRQSTALLLLLNESPDGASRSALLDRVRKVVTDVVQDRVSSQFSGISLLEQEINRLVLRDNVVFTPILSLLVGIIAWLIMGNLRLTGIALTNTAMVVSWGIGTMLFMGESLNTSTVIIAPVLTVVSFAASIHLLTRFREHCFISGQTTGEAIHSMVAALWLTTAAGYLSFLVTTVRPVRTTGLYTGLAVLAGFALTMVFIPAALMLFHRTFDRLILPPSPPGKGIQGLLDGMCSLAVQRHRIICVLFVALMGYGMMGMTKLRFNSNFMDYLKDSNDLKQEILAVEQAMGGTTPYDLVLTATSEADDFNQPDSLRMLMDLRRDIMNHMGEVVSGGYSIADYFSELNLALHDDAPEFFRLPGTTAAITDLYELSDPEVTDALVSPDRRQARLSLTNAFTTTEVSRKFLAFARGPIQQKLGTAWRLELTGISYLYSHIDDRLEYSQVASFATALLLIVTMMALVCRNLRLLLLSLFPNLFPIITVLGVMGWSGFELNASTIMIASVTIGIAVDDTVHFITWVRRHLQAGMSQEVAVREAFQDTGRPIMITSLALAAGYVVIVTGSVIPTITFGALAALAMLLALAGDLLLLPALLMLTRNEMEAGATAATPALATVKSPR